jgi:hypothetical protein
LCSGGLRDIEIPPQHVLDHVGAELVILAQLRDELTRSMPID